MVTIVKKAPSKNVGPKTKELAPSSTSKDLFKVSTEDTGESVKPSKAVKASKDSKVGKATSKVVKSSDKEMTYDASDIAVLDNLEAVRTHLGFYIGGRDSAALTRMVREIVANSIDEILAGHGKLVEVTIDNNEITVYDEGRGIPVDVHPKTKRSVIIDVFSTLHAGGKTKSGTAYKNTAGIHGVGASVVNFLSTKFEVWTFRNNKWNYLRFQDGKLKEGLVTKTPPKRENKAPNKGTIIRFTPDFSCFNANVRINTAEILDYLHINAYLVPTAKFVANISGKTTVFQHKNGLKDYLTALLDEHKAEAVGKPLVYSCEDFTAALQWSTHSEELITSYVNGTKTINGGTHVNGMYDAITKALLPMKGKRDYKPADLRTGLIAVINVHIKSPEFSDGQTKSKLGSESAYAAVNKELIDKLGTYFRGNKSLVTKILNRAVEVGNLYKQFQASKQVSSLLKTSGKGAAKLPSKLVQCNTNVIEDRILYLIEGESALGCFLGGTEVLLNDGTHRTFEQLVSDYAKGIDHVGKCWDNKNSKAKEFEFFHPHITKYVTEVVDVEFEDGSVFTCTPEHLFLLESGKYKQAESLTLEDDVRNLLS